MVKKIQASVHYFSFFQQMMIAHFIFSANDEKCFLFNHILNGFFRGSFWGGGGGGVPPVKFFTIKLETWNLVRTYTRICSFRKYTF